MKGRILVVDDEPEMRGLLETDLGMRGFVVATAGSADQAFDLLREGPFDVVLTDIFMPGINGVELCDRIATNTPDVPVVVMTAFGSMEAAVEALRAGAFDFVTKPLDPELLALSLGRAVDHHHLVERVKLLSHPVEPSDASLSLIGVSPAMTHLKQQILRIAETDATVLITGESGTGKELAAREICKHGMRRDKPFVTVDCAAIPAPLMESELFGHARGAFTDARAARRGLFVEAHRGTLFLDEVGELPLELQPKLLRALENRAIRPLGSESETTIDARVLAATNRDLLEAVAAGRFREDLYYRLNVIQLKIPPLRERGTDALDLALHFVAHFAEQHGKDVRGLSDPAAQRVMDYQWPGNVRELRNAIESAVVLTSHAELIVEDFPMAIRSYRNIPLTGREGGRSEPVTLEEMERRHILQVLQTAGGNRTHAARMLGLDRKTLYRKLQRFAETGSSP